jgi:hypothetical protein
MLPSESPFSNPADLKELPHAIDGSFEWLRATQTHDEWAIGDELRNELPAQLNALRKSAQSCGLTIPLEFVNFIQSPELHRHLRSANGCYLRLAESVLPFEAGFLIRFLSDQQDCCFWYLFTNADGTDHCVVSSIPFFDADDVEFEPHELVETAFQIWATSFEGFLSRFWIENEIDFMGDDDESEPPEIDPKFLSLYSR